MVIIFALVLGLVPGGLISPTRANAAEISDTCSLNSGTYTLSGVNWTGKYIQINSNQTVTITVTGDNAIDNSTAGNGSPIRLLSGARLNLVINGTLTLHGQNGQRGRDRTEGAAGDTTLRPAGFAGINVPTGTTLFVSGTGQLNAYGGAAGDGGWGSEGGGGGGYPAAGIGGGGGGAGAGTGWTTDNKNYFGGDGGGGAGAGIGGNGGAGGAGGYTASGGTGKPGGAGGDCGTVTIACVCTAIGGAGGNANRGGNGELNGTPGAGAAFTGQPATYGSGGGGFTGGHSFVAGGGGYYSAGTGARYFTGGVLGGGGGRNNENYHLRVGGTGGKGGAGGKISIWCAPADLYIRNGNISSSASPGEQPTAIYAQLGYDVANVRAKKSSVSGRTDAAVASELASAGVAKNITVSGYTGIGSGAGYTESGNGTVSLGYIGVDLTNQTVKVVDGAENGRTGTFAQIAAGTVTITGVTASGGSGGNLYLAPNASGLNYQITGSTTAYALVVNSGNVSMTLKDVTINRSSTNGTSAMAIYGSASVRVELAGTNRLYGGPAGNGVGGSKAAHPGGVAAGAGIAVPTGATLYLKGDGTLYAYGGDAGNGGNCTGENWGASGGGGAGAGIGGLGGVGSNMNTAFNGNYSSNGVTGVISRAGAGGSAGTITVEARVYAYGGGGGSGGSASNQVLDMCSGGGGGGGYPAAGIGGGGAGGGAGDHALGGGGFSGGAGRIGAGGTNGQPGNATEYSAGGGYFAAATKKQANPGLIYGGGGKWGSYTNDGSSTQIGGSDGGAGGSGGKITIMDKDIVQAFNGSKLTTAVSGASSNPWGNNATTIRTQKTQGYGAGAGFTETDGTITFAGAPGVPTGQGAAIGGTYRNDVTLTWTPPANTGGTGVVLSGYTILSEAFGINTTVTTAQCTASGSSLTYTIKNVKSNTTGTFQIIANNAKGSSAAATTNSVSSFGVPLTPADAQGAVSKADMTKGVIYWKASPARGSGTITNRVTDDKLDSYQIVLTPLGKPDTTTDELYDLKPLAGQEEESGSKTQFEPPYEGAETINLTVPVGELVSSSDENFDYELDVTGLHFGTVYQVAITPVNGLGSGEACYAAKLETMDVANAPAVTVIRNGSDEDENRTTNLTVSWEHPENAREGSGLPEIYAFNVIREAVDADGNKVSGSDAAWTFQKNDSGDWVCNGWADPLTVTAVDGVPNYSFVDTTVPANMAENYGVTYVYSVNGLNELGTNTVGEGMFGDGKYTYPPVAPAAPTAVPNTNRTGHVTIAWTKPANNGNEEITGYQIFRDGVKVGEVNANVFKFTDPEDVSEALKAGTTYRYTVAAVNANGVGAQSEALEATTNGVPSRPGGVNAEAKGASYVKVSWEIPSGPNGTKPDGETPLPYQQFLVKWSGGQETLDLAYNGAEYVPAENGQAVNQDADGVYTVCLNPSETVASSKRYFKYDSTDGTYYLDVRGLTQGTSYEFRVSAVTEAGEGEYGSARATTWDTPGMPVDLKVEKVPSTGQFTLTWKPSNNGGTLVQSYYIDVFEQDTYLAGGDPVYSFDKKVTGTETEYAETTNYKRPGGTETDNGFKGGGNYVVVLTPKNSVGNGVPAVVYTQAVTIPHAPQTVKATNAAGKLSESQINVTWTPVDNSGGSDIKAYEVKVVSRQINPDGTPVETNVTSNETATLVREYASGDKYIMEYYGGVIVEYDNSDRKNAFSATVKGLDGWTEYQISVYAYNEANPTIPGMATTASWLKTTKRPDPVQNLTVKPTGGASELRVDWQRPQVDGGVEITRYYLELYQGEWTEAQIVHGDAASSLLTVPAGATNAHSVGGSTYTYTFSGTVYDANSRAHTIVDGKSYTVRVRAINAIDMGGGAVAVGISKQGAKAPKDTRIQMINGTKLTYHWTNPTSNDYKGGKPKGYEIILLDSAGNELMVATYDENGALTKQPDENRTILFGDTLKFEGGQDGTGDTVKGAEAAVTATITGLTMGGRYQLRARLVTDLTLEEKIPCEASTAVPFKMWELPQEPSNIQANATHMDAGIRLSWEYPDNDGDSDSNPNTNTGNNTGVTDYRVFWRHSKTEVEGEEVDTKWKLVEWDQNSDKCITDTDASDAKYTDTEPSTAKINATGVKDGTYYIEFHGLIDGDTYEFRVISMNGAGWGNLEDATVSSAVPNSAPQAPAIGEVLTGDKSATLTEITPPAEKVYKEDGSWVWGNGGAPITAYAIYAATAVKQGDKYVRQGEWEQKTTIEYTGPASLKNVRIPHLENNVDYMIMVRAVNEACVEGVHGMDSNSQYVRVGMPLTPTGIRVNLGRANSAVVTYNAAEGNGSPIQYYKVYVSKYDEASDTWSEPKAFDQELVNGELVDCGEEFVKYIGQVATVYGTEMGDTLKIQVSAVNRVGESPMSEPALEATVGAPSVPDITMIDKAHDGVTVNWLEASSNGAKMQGYAMYLKQTAAAPGSSAIEDTKLHRIYQEGNALKKEIVSGETKDEDGTVITLLKGAEYQVQVAAVNRAGESPKSTAKTFTFGVPKPPTIPTTDGITFGEGQLTVRFEAPEDTGGFIEVDGQQEKEPLTAFAVYANGIARVLVSLTETPGEVPARFGDLQWTILGESVMDQPPVATYNEETGLYEVVVSGLANGSTYNLQVSAFNQYGEGDLSEGQEDKPATKAGMPTNIVPTPISDTQIDLKWRAPAYNGGSSIESYIVKVFNAEIHEDITDKVTLTVNATGSNVSNTTATVTGLTRGTEYYFEVQAVTRGGTLGAVGTSRSVKTFYPPTMPTIVSWSSAPDPQKPGKYTLTVNWKAPDDDGGTPITNYNVLIGGNAQNTAPLGGDVRSYVLSGLMLNKSYNVSVQAFNKVGSSRSVQSYIKIGQLEATTITKVETELISNPNAEVAGSAGESTMSVSYNEVSGADAGYVLFNLGDGNSFPTLQTDGTPDLEKINSLTTLEMVSLLKTAEADGFFLSSASSGATTIDVEDAYDMPRVGSTAVLVVCAKSSITGLGLPSEPVVVHIGASNAPKLTSAVSGYQKITATWEEPENTNTLDGWSIKGYQFYLDGKTLGEMIDASTLEGNGPYTKELPVASKTTNWNSDSVLTVTVITAADDGSETREGVPSEGKTVRPWTDPSAPAVQGDPTAGNASFKITFSKSSGNGLGDPSYRIIWNGQAKLDKDVAFVDNGDGTITATVTGVKNGKDPETGKGYEVYVEAYTVDTKTGTEYTSKNNEIKNVATGIPPAPILETANITASDFTLEWSDAAQISGTKTYNVYIKEDGAVRAEFKGINDKSYKVTKLSETESLRSGVPYVVTVTTENDIGESDESNALVVRLGAPRVPLDVNAIPANGNVTVTWLAPVDNGSPITKYYINLTDEDGSEMEIEVDRNLTSHTIENLVNGTTYSVTVTAENNYGRGVPSEAILVTPGTEPDAPASAEAEAINDTTVRVTWEPPEDNGGMAINYYTVSGGASPVVVSGDQDRQVDITGLTSGKTYTFKVTASNGVGTGPEQTTNEVTTHTIPGKPGWERLSSVNNAITAMWYPPTENGGSEVESYKVFVYEYDNNGDLIETPKYTIENDALLTENLTLNAKGYYTYTLDQNQYPVSLYKDYKVSVAAKNETVEGYGPESDRLTVTVTGALANSAPGSPEDIKVTAANGTATVTWSPPTYDGGGIGEYQLYYRVYDPSVTQPTYTLMSVSSLKTSATVKGLTDGTQYEFYLTASNSYGTSDPSFKVIATPEKVELPGNIENLRYYTDGEGNITFKWEGGAGKDVEFKYMMIGGGESYEGTLRRAGDTTSVTFPRPGASALQDVVYSFMVQAMNSGGATPYATVLASKSLNVDLKGNGDYVLDQMGNEDADFNGTQDPAPEIPAPSAPELTKVSVNGKSSIDIYWDAFELGDERWGSTKATPVGYRVYIDGIATDINVTKDEATGEVTAVPDGFYRYAPTGGLTPGAVYTIQVSAVNEDADEGPRSSTYQCYIQESDAPTDVTAEVDESYTMLHLSWKPPVTTRKIEGYYLQVNGKDDTQKRNVAETTDETTGETTVKLSNMSVAADQEYIIRVFAKFKNADDSVEVGRYSEPVTVSTVIPTPEKPTLETVTATRGEGTLATDTVTLTWTPVPVSEANQIKVYINGELKDTKTNSEGLDTASVEFLNSPGKTYTAYIVATKAVGGYTPKDSVRSDMKSATTLKAGAFDPAMVQNLEQVSIDKKAGEVTLQWDSVELPAGAVDYNNSHTGAFDKVVYLVYGGQVNDDGSMPSMDQPIMLVDNVVPDENGKIVCKMTGLELLKDYVYKVAAVSHYTGSGTDTLDGDNTPEMFSDEGTTFTTLGFKGIDSDVCEVSTKSTTPAPAAPELRQSNYDATSGNVTLTWAAMEGIGTYKVYGYDKDGKEVEVTGVTISGNSAVFQLPTEAGRSEYAFRVAAVVTDPETGEEIEGAKSVAASISTRVPPPNPDAPTLLRNAFVEKTEKNAANKDVQRGYISLFWKAPTDTTVVANNNITSYTVMMDNKVLATVKKSGEGWSIEYDNTNYPETHTYDQNTPGDKGPANALIYNGETGEFRFVFDCYALSIQSGDMHSVAVRSNAEIMNEDGTSVEYTLHSGVQQETFMIAYGVNVDDDDDGTPDNNLDSNHDGYAETSILTLRYVGTKPNSLSLAAENFTLTYMDDTPVASDSVTVTVADDNSFEIVVKKEVSAGAAAAAEGDTSGDASAMKLVVEKAGYTKYIVTDLPATEDAANIAHQLGQVEMYIGDVDENGTINANDLLVVSKNLGKSTSEILLGDLDGNGQINANDVLVVSRNLGKASKIVAYNS